MAPPRLTLRKDDYPSSGLGSKEALETFFRPLNGHLDAVSNVLGKSVVLGQNAELKSVVFKTPSTPWTALSLAAGVTNLGGTDAVAAYRKEPNGDLTLKGSVVRATVGTISTLPAALLPAEDVIRPTLVQTGAVRQAAGLLVNATTGVISITTNAPSTWGVIDCRFACADPSPGVMSAFPLTVSTAVTKPALVILAQLVDQTTRGAAASVSGVHWEPAGNGQIKILNIPGLNYGRTYQATLLIASAT